MTKNQPRRLWCSFAAALLFLGLAGTAVAADQHENMLNVGKKTGVTLRTDTMVGDQMLEAGRYRVQHRTEGDKHFVKFVRVDGRH